MQFTSWESFAFYALASIALAAAFVVVTSRNPVHSALGLISTLLGVGGLFVLLRAEFLAGVQVLVYVGGVMVLFLFVIMLVSVEGEEQAHSRVFSRQTIAAVVMAGIMAALLVMLVSPAVRVLEAPKVVVEQAERAVSTDTEELGEALYRRAALPFEVASVLLLVAIVGAVLLARERRQERIFD
jgi:NADH-quinone oxidoreductase subunit J